MAAITSFRDLDAWQFGIQLVATVYGVVAKLPDSERFGLVTQMRRAAVSIPSNVAEGQASGPGGRYRHHVRIALGSWAELVTHLEVIKVLGLLAPHHFGDFERDLERTGQLLHGLDRSLRQKQVGGGALDSRTATREPTSNCEARTANRGADPL
jgi:four helix bundle protein